MTGDQERKLQGIIDRLLKKGWEDEPLVRLIRQTASNQFIVPPPISEKEIRNLLGRNNLPINVSAV